MRCSICPSIGYPPLCTAVEWGRLRAGRCLPQHVDRRSYAGGRDTAGLFSLHHREGRLARDQSLDHLLTLLSRHIRARPDSQHDDALVKMNRLRDYLHAHMADNPSLDDLALQCGLDRFRLTRQFTRAFGQSPHAYLVRLRAAGRTLVVGAGARTGAGRHAGGICRSEPFGSLVPACLPFITGGLSTPVHKRSIPLICHFR